MYTGNTAKQNRKIAIAGVLTALCCMGLLFVSALLPQKLIQKNAEKSAEFYTEHDLFEMIVPHQPSAKRDNYADSITSCIAFQLGNSDVLNAVNSSNPFLRMLKASYTTPENNNVAEGFRQAVKEGAAPNATYSRYWHGSAAVLRVLFTVLPVQGLHYLFPTIGILFHIALLVLMFKNKDMLPAICYLVGMLLAKAPLGFFCFEYAHVLILVPVFTFLVYRKVKTRRNDALSAEISGGMPLGGYFLMAGIITCFLDFLTAETLTFTVPMFVVLCCMQNPGNQPAITFKKEKVAKERSPFSVLWRNGLLWLSGYVGMFLLKWVLNYIFLGKEEFVTALSNTAKRTVGEVHLTANLASPKADFFERIRILFTRNFACLFGIPERVSDEAGAWIVMGILLLFGLLWFFLRIKKSKVKGKKTSVFFPAYFLLAMVPLIRFAVLSNHSFEHSFFTYRALAVTVMVVVYDFIRTTILSHLLKK